MKSTYGCYGTERGHLHVLIVLIVKGETGEGDKRGASLSFHEGSYVYYI